MTYLSLRSPGEKLMPSYKSEYAAEIQVISAFSIYFLLLQTEESD
jgi:hypothetical protein